MMLALGLLLVLVTGLLYALSQHPGFRGRSIEEVAHFILQVGEYLEAVDGKRIDSRTNIDELLANSIDRRVVLTELGQQTYDKLTSQ